MRKAWMVWQGAAWIWACVAAGFHEDTAAAQSWRAGVARVDITPDYPVRLSGYGSRTTEHEGVALRIWTKALALQWGDEEPAVILTIDSTGVPGVVRQQVLRQLAAGGTRLADERFSLHSSHTHSAPHIRGYLPFIFGEELPADQNERIDRYTREVTGKMAAAVKQALADLKPAHLDWGIGAVKFAGNRRFRTASGFVNSPNPAGPTDHSLPVLRVADGNGRIRVIFTSYACHCTTLSFNKVHGDWAGEAQRELELRFPGAIAMTAIGCGGDQNPYPRREWELARLHGIALGNEVARVLKRNLKSVRGPLHCRTRRVDLPLDVLPSKEEWIGRTRDKNKHVAYQARHFLAMLDRGEPVPARVPYEVQAWQFAGDLAIVNLPGEVVVDYSLRLKREYDRARVWVNAYTNDVPCYIPSQRVWKEGGYEAAGAMLYYGWPARLASGVEGAILAAIREILPGTFKAPPVRADNAKDGASAGR